ncbi:MAG: patatin-like phospholipase family protein [Gammaproteobacteria bacterium]|nr:patatin-like phospholipase family protein [Gammaproteobacteria bacterium]
MEEVKKPARIGVVLSSGGGRGVYAHTGFLLALRQLGIEVSAIAGCSAGALVGGIAASGADLQQWSQVIASVRTREYWTPDPWLQFVWRLAVNKGRGYTGLSDTAAAIAFCRRNLAVQTFEECRVPFYSLAMDLGRGAKVLFAAGELAPRMMASAAMPLLYRPVEIAGSLYTDGAVIELAPTEAICCKHNLDALIVHHTSVHREGGEGMAWAVRQPWSLIEILNLLLYRHRPWYLSDQPLAFQRCPHGCGTPLIVLECDLPELVWPLNSGGPRVQAAALSQSLASLQPYAGILMSDPHRLPLPRVSAGQAATPAARCNTAPEPEDGEHYPE